MKAQLPARREIVRRLEGVNPEMTSEPFPDIYEEIARACGGKSLTAQEIFDAVIGPVVEHISEVSTHPIDMVCLTIPQWIGAIVDDLVVRHQCYPLFDAWHVSPARFRRNRR